MLLLLHVMGDVSFIISRLDRLYFKGFTHENIHFSSEKRLIMTFKMNFVLVLPHKTLKLNGLQTKHSFKIKK